LSPKKSSGFGSYPIRYLALGLLMQGPGHGYQLDQDLEDDFGMIWKAGQTKLYVTLSSLEEEGLLASELEPQENRPDRKVYSLTEKGRRAFREWVSQPVPSLRAARVELIAKLRFYDLLGLPGILELIAAQQEILRSMIVEWEAEQGSAEDQFLRHVHEFRIRQARFIIDWLKDFQASQA
jgi:DNA-binding PadR family transcriptional regulator